MSSRQGNFLALFFAVCFLALQFHTVADTQLEQSDNQNFQIQVVSNSLIDNGFDNSFISAQVSHTPHASLSQNSSKRNQKRQVFENKAQLSKQPYQHFIRQCLAKICQYYQHRLTIAFSHQQHVELSFESSPLISGMLRQQPLEEPDQQIS